MVCMKYGSLNSDVIAKLRSIVGDRWVITDKTIVESYLYDKTPIGVRPKATSDVVVVKPRTTAEVSEIMRFANSEKIPVYPHGGRTGLAGGCIPTIPGIILSLERMDNIEIDKDNLVAIAEAGVTLRRLIEEAEKADLSFPPHPGDEGATIGGLIATNAGGARAIRTGVMRNVVLGIEVVLATGDILNLGGKLLKNNMGYNLMHLIIGSEGTLGIVTKAILRLYPKLSYTATIIVPFNDRKNAFRFSLELLSSGIWPLMIEYADRELLEKSASFIGLKWPYEEGRYIILITIAESNENNLMNNLEKLYDIAVKVGSLEPYVATRKDEQDTILKIRSEIYTTLSSNTYELLDITVPPSTMPILIDYIEDIANKYRVYMPVYGHVGDGNLHVHIMKSDELSRERYEEIRDEIYDMTIRLGGTITGEHGVGGTRVKYMKKYLGKTHLELMKAIKRVFDPNYILNPGKVIPLDSNNCIE